LKILLIVSSYAPNVGGLQSVTSLLAQRLSQREHDLTVLTNRYPRALHQEEMIKGVHVIRWHFLRPGLQQLLHLRFDLFLAGFLYFPLTLMRLVLLLRRERPDVVNLHFVGAPALFLLLARWLISFRLVVSLHGDDVEGLSRRGRFDRWVFCSILRRAEVVTACSRYLLERAIVIQPSAKQNGRVIHNGIDQFQGVRAVGGKCGVFAAGRMVRDKGFDVLLRAYCNLKKKLPLVLVGDGPEQERLARLAQALGLTGEIRFRGNQDHRRVMEQMAGADVVAIPSLHESFGLIALEAMALGKPIVASSVGGLSEVLRGADAFLVEPGDPAELAAAIDSVQERLHSEPEFGARNRECAARFSIDHMTDGYVEAYRQATQRPLRVAFIHPFLFRYARGIERYTFKLADQLAVSGVEVHLVTWDWCRLLHIDEIDSRIRIHRMPTARYFAAKVIVPFYLWHLLTHRYDFVWIGFAGYGEAEALMLARRQSFGVVFHYPVAQVPHRYREFKRYGLTGRAAKIVSVSEYVSEGVREFFGRDSTVIHHGVDTTRFKPDEEKRRVVRKELRISDAPLLVTAAALEERKGIQWVLRALPKILERFPETIYLVLGGGGYRAHLEQLANDLGIQSHVRFMGEQENVTPFFQAADVSLILSRGEASSLTALESLACGIPVIAARRAPFDELINDKCGMFVDEQDALAVAAAVESLLANSEWRRVMGQRGRAHVQKHFTWDRAGSQYKRLMESHLQ
jgi:glycosyltransferase involved in cell wall biosynthesis